MFVLQVLELILNSATSLSRVPAARITTVKTRSKGFATFSFFKTGLAAQFCVLGKPFGDTCRTRLFSVFFVDDGF
ncbi:hypothetical protein EV421DRAFT_1812371 [Armillaria borealis]|uniref:Secreted protein n=1 Tax=Armillaria borealis TaxID=47425 RepID=A0AA39MPC7_9AGAR|nr:hypothetical protein EV421DRAFT_1812371 [Armillaria borealis]